MKFSPEVLIYLQTVKNYFKTNEEAREYFTSKNKKHRNRNRNRKRNRNRNNRFRQTFKVRKIKLFKKPNKNRNKLS